MMSCVWLTPLQETPPSTANSENLDGVDLLNSQHQEHVSASLDNGGGGRDPDLEAALPLNNAAAGATPMTSQPRGQVNSIDNLHVSQAAFTQRPSSSQSSQHSNQDPATTRERMEELIERARQQNAANTIQCWWRFRHHLNASHQQDSDTARGELRCLFASKRRQAVAAKSRTVGANAARRRHEEAARLERQRAVMELRERRAREAELRRQRGAEEAATSKLGGACNNKKTNLQLERQRREERQQQQQQEDTLSTGEHTERALGAIFGSVAGQLQKPVDVAVGVDTARSGGLSGSGTKTTLEDILSTLKQLEEAP